MSAVFTLPIKVNGAQALLMACAQVFTNPEGVKIVQDDIDGRMALHQNFRRANTQEIEMEVEAAFEKQLRVPDFEEVETHPDLDGKRRLSEIEVLELNPPETRRYE